MMIIGCDYHPSWQQICWVDTATGETGEKKLEHASGEAEKFYRGLAWGCSDWNGVDRELPVVCRDGCDGAGHDLWIGDAAKIRACDVRAQKHDRRDAALILKLLLEGRFPRIWTPSGEEKDLRQLLIHRLQAGADSRTGKKRVAAPGDESRQSPKKRKLWSKAGEKVLRELPLKPWTSRRREDLFKVREMLSAQIDSARPSGGGSCGEE